MMDMAPVALECPVAGCDLGEEGAKFTTPELEAEICSHENVRTAW